MGDQQETLVLDATGGFATAADYDLAQVQATAQGARLDCRIQRNLSITVEMTDITGTAAIFVATRSSGKLNPDITDDTDWARMNRTADIDKATGVDTSQPLIEVIELTGVGRHTLDLPVTNRFVSVIVWQEAGAATGNVYMYRSA